MPVTHPSGLFTYYWSDIESRYFGADGYMTFIGAVLIQPVGIYKVGEKVHAIYNPHDSCIIIQDNAEDGRVEAYKVPMRCKLDEIAITQRLDE